MYITVNNLADNLVNHIYDYSIGDKNFWISKFKDVIKKTTYSNADDIVSDCFSNDYVRHTDLAVDVINCLLYLEDNWIKQYMINNILHILKYINKQFLG